MIHQDAVGINLEEPYAVLTQGLPSPPSPPGALQSAQEQNHSALFSPSPKATRPKYQKSMAVNDSGSSEGQQNAPPATERAQEPMEPFCPQSSPELGQAESLGRRAHRYRSWDMAVLCGAQPPEPGPSCVGFQHAGLPQASQSTVKFLLSRVLHKSCSC